MRNSSYNLVTGFPRLAFRTLSAVILLDAPPQMPTLLRRGCGTIQHGLAEWRCLRLGVNYNIFLTLRAFRNRYHDYCFSLLVVFITFRCCEICKLFGTRAFSYDHISTYTYEHRSKYDIRWSRFYFTTIANISVSLAYQWYVPHPHMQKTLGRIGCKL